MLHWDITVHSPRYVVKVKEHVAVWCTSNLWKIWTLSAKHIKKQVVINSDFRMNNNNGGITWIEVHNISQQIKQMNRRSWLRWLNLTGRPYSWGLRKEESKLLLVCGLFLKQKYIPFCDGRRQGVGMTAFCRGGRRWCSSSQIRRRRSVPLTTKMLQLNTRVVFTFWF